MCVCRWGTMICPCSRTIDRRSIDRSTRPLNPTATHQPAPNKHAHRPYSLGPDSFLSAPTCVTLPVLPVRDSTDLTFTSFTACESCCLFDGVVGREGRGGGGVGQSGAVPCGLVVWVPGRPRQQAQARARRAKGGAVIGACCGIGARGLASIDASIDPSIEIAIETPLSPPFIPVAGAPQPTPPSIHWAVNPITRGRSVPLTMMTVVVCLCTVMGRARGVEAL